MIKDKLEKKALLILKRLTDDSKRDISVAKCNSYVSDISALKEALYDEEFEWVEDYHVIEEVLDDDEFDAVSEVVETLEIVRDQLSRIISDLRKDVVETSQSQSSLILSRLQKHSKNAKAKAKAEVKIKKEINGLVKEFNEEANKSKPSKSELMRLRDALKKLDTLDAISVAERLNRRITDIFYSYL